MNPQHPQSTIDTDKPTLPSQRMPYAKLVSVTAACGAILVLSVWLMEVSPEMPWRALIALLPMLALGLFLWLLIGLIRGTDERIQRIELLALVIAAATIAALWFAAGLLHSAGVMEIPVHHALFLVLPGIFLVYGIVKLMLMWRDVWVRA